MLQRIIPTLLIAAIILSCNVHTLPVEHTNERPYASRDNVLAVFMDGTNNKIQNRKPHTNTHVQRLHHLADTGFRSLYVEGVGTRLNVPGLLWGVGTKNRIATAYCYLSKYYSPSDTIVLFGFSRGSNQCRILSNIIYTFGVLDLNKIESDKTKHRLIKNFYKKYMGHRPYSFKKAKGLRYLAKWNKNHKDQQIGYDTADVPKIMLMGLWDTVEAFNLDGDGELSAPLSRHFNQIRNIVQVYHAVSLDDNRSDIYTPILINDKRVNYDSNNKFEEVWFSGSHRDIGGGPNKNPGLSTVSLKWMMEKTKDFKLFRDTTFTVDPLGYVHNAAAWPIWWPMGGNRNINYYHYGIDAGKGKIKIHQSVINRLEKGEAPKFKYWFIRKDWYERRPFKDCFTIEWAKKKKGDKYVRVKKVTLKKNYDCPCIEIDKTPL